MLSSAWKIHCKCFTRGLSWLELLCGTVTFLSPLSFRKEEVWSSHECHWNFVPGRQARCPDIGWTHPVLSSGSGRQYNRTCSVCLQCPWPQTRICGFGQRGPDTLPKTQAPIAVFTDSPFSRTFCWCSTSSRSGPGARGPPWVRHWLPRDPSPMLPRDAGALSLESQSVKPHRRIPCEWVRC